MRTKILILLLFAASVLSAQSVNLSVDDTEIAEDGSETATLTVTLSQAVAVPVDVVLSVGGTVDGAGVDYTIGTTNLTIAAGDLSATTTLVSITDALAEGDEIAVVSIDSVTGAVENGVQEVSITIEDDDQVSVTLAAASDNIAENGAGTTVTATLSATAVHTVRVDLTLTGAASLDIDYEISSQMITIPAGSLSGFVTITPLNDGIGETNEQIVVNIGSTSTNATSGDPSSAVVTILDDDDYATVTLAAASAAIDEDGGATVVTATLSQATVKTVTVNLTTGGTATAGDFTISSNSITINIGETTGTATVIATQDAVDDNDETVIVRIVNVINAQTGAAAQQSATITILDDDLDVEPDASAGDGGGGCSFQSAISLFPLISLMMLMGLHRLVRRRD